MKVSSTHVRPTNIAQLAKTLGQAIGFDRVGIAPARPLARAQYYKAWLASGHAAGMAYLHRHVELRADPAKLLPGARSIICVALNYRRRPAERRTEGPQGRVAMYAQCPDYHVLMRSMLERLLERLRQEAGVHFEARVCVDTAPVLERELACSAGVGWIGKNTCLLDRQLGSYVFLGEMFTTLDLPVDEPVADGCASCTRCVDACPTGALTEAHNLDASRCISYLTIEHRSDIPVALHSLSATGCSAASVPAGVPVQPEGSRRLQFEATGWGDARPAGPARTAGHGQGGVPAVLGRNRRPPGSGIYVAPECGNRTRERWRSGRHGCRCSCGRPSAGRCRRERPGSLGCRGRPSAAASSWWEGG